MGIERIGRDRVGAIAATLDAEISDLAEGPVDARAIPYIWLDATCVKCRRGGRVASTAVITAIGEVFQGAAWQRCAVHLMRDCMREAGSWRLRRRVGRIASSVFRARDAATAVAMYHAACEILEGRCPGAARVLEEAEPDALAYLDFPPSHWKRLRTNNVQERASREIKRRSRVVQGFPPLRVRCSGSWAPSCATRPRHGPARATSRRRRWLRCTTRRSGRAPRAVMTGPCWKNRQ